MKKLSAEIRIGRVSSEDDRVKAIGIFLDRPNRTDQKAQGYGDAFAKLPLVDTVAKHDDNTLFLHPYDRTGSQRFIDSVVELAHELFTVTEVKG